MWHQQLGEPGFLTGMQAGHEDNRSACLPGSWQGADAVDCSTEAGGLSVTAGVLPRISEPEFLHQLFQLLRQLQQ